MKKALSLLFVLAFCSLFAQKKGTYYSHFPVHLSYRTKFLQSSPYDGLNSLNRYKFSQPLNYVGISAFEHLSVGWHSFKQVVSLDWIVPNRLSISDSCDFAISGFQYGMVLFGHQIIRKKILFMDVTLGLNTGRTKLMSNQFGNFKNPYFSPRIAIHPCFRIRRISLSLMIQYDYDVSKSRWIEMSGGGDSKKNPESLSHSGISASVNLGYIVRKESAKDKKIRQNKKKNKK